MKKLMAANWKMYKTVAQGVETVSELVGLLEGKLPVDREVLICPSAFMLAQVGAVAKGGFAVGAQNFYPAVQGAYTGEVAPDQLLDLDCRYALVGHSERRHVLGETDEFLAEKVAFGLNAGLKIILCIGEKIEERKAGKVEDVLERQLKVGLAGVLTDITAENLAVAYEPVWAIGTGEVAGSVDILAAHAFVRQCLRALVPAVADGIRILYGGSVKPENAAEIIRLDNVDGVLVGGASLKAESFSKIVLA